MNKSFKIAALNILASIFCFVVYSNDVKNNLGTLLFCMAFAMISYVYLTIAFIFTPIKVQPTQGSEV